MIHLDTYAAMKPVRPQAHSDDLSRWLSQRPGIPVLIEVELMRATWRSAPDRAARAPDVVRGIGVVTLSPAVIARAAGYPDPDQRSLDAVRLATAEHVVFVTQEALTAFVAYDERLLAAARDAGLPVGAPGLA